MFTDCSSNSIINIIKKNKESELEFDNNDDYY